MIVFPFGRRRRSARDLLSFLSLFSFLPSLLPSQFPSGRSLPGKTRSAADDALCSLPLPLRVPLRRGAADRARGGSAAKRRAKKSGRGFVSLRINVSASADGGKDVRGVVATEEGLTKWEFGHGTRGERGMFASVPSWELLTSQLRRRKECFLPP